ncbi:hypothetical protein PFDG_05022, partial [Plasmodium falciparum Dd2]
MFGDASHIMLKSGMYTNEGNKSCACSYKEKSSSSNKGHENYLNTLKDACFAGVGTVCLFFCPFRDNSGMAAGATAA